MKKARLILSASMLTIAAFTSVTIISCNKDDDTCPVGYEGDKCKTLSRDKFLAPNGAMSTWTGHEECTTGNDDYSITLAPSSASDIQLVYGNLYNQQLTATAQMTGPNGFSFSGNASGSITFQGTGSLDQSTGRLTVHYTISTAGIQTNECDFVGTKQ